MYIDLYIYVYIHYVYRGTVLYVQYVLLLPLPYLPEHGLEVPERTHELLTFAGGVPPSSVPTLASQGQVSTVWCVQTSTYSSPCTAASAVLDRTRYLLAAWGTTTNRT